MDVDGQNWSPAVIIPFEINGKESIVAAAKILPQHLLAEEDVVGLIRIEEDWKTVDSP